MTKKATNVMYSFLAHFTPPPKKKHLHFLQMLPRYLKSNNKWMKKTQLYNVQCTLQGSYYLVSNDWHCPFRRRLKKKVIIKYQAGREEGERGIEERKTEKEKNLLDLL